MLCHSDANDVELEERSSSRIRLSSRNNGLAITVQRVQHTYMVVLRMSDSLFPHSSGVLYIGCDADQLINRDTVNSGTYEVISLSLATRSSAHQLRRGHLRYVRGHQSIATRLSAHQLRRGHHSKMRTRSSAS